MLEAQKNWSLQPATLQGAVCTKPWVTAWCLEQSTPSTGSFVWELPHHGCQHLWGMWGNRRSKIIFVHLEQKNLKVHLLTLASHAAPLWSDCFQSTQLHIHLCHITIAWDHCSLFHVDLVFKVILFYVKPKGQHPQNSLLMCFAPCVLERTAFPQIWLWFIFTN